jgi:hypothetical protein
VIDQIHTAFERINAVISTGISAEEQQQLRKLIERMHANLEMADFG